MGEHCENSAPAVDIARLADHLFRNEAGKLVSILTGIFGIDRLQMAEDVVQEALMRALRSWPYGIPENPAAWLTRTAKNIALDVVRREKNFEEKQPQIISFIESWGENAEPAAQFDEEVQDGRLRLMFACCHPAIPAEAQAALALKTLCAFSPAEIAKAFLTSEAAIAKRLTRARQRIQELRIPFEIPAGDDLPARLDGVLQTLYLLYNEGYKASVGDRVIREDLCHEAIRLVEALASHPVGNTPRVHALAALMLLNAARLPARTDPSGGILRLEEQDRSLWDRQLLGRGMLALARSAAGNEITEFHLQAAIAAVHSAAPDYLSTDWPRILDLYDRLIQLNDSPVILLNRAVAIGQVHGPAAGLQALEKVRAEKTMESYHLLYAVLAEFEWQLKEFDSAAGNLRKAMELTSMETERQLLQRRLETCEQKPAS